MLERVGPRSGKARTRACRRRERGAARSTKLLPRCDRLAAAWAGLFEARPAILTEAGGGVVLSLAPSASHAVGLPAGLANDGRDGGLKLACGLSGVERGRSALRAPHTNPAVGGVNAVIARPFRSPPRRSECRTWTAAFCMAAASVTV